MFFLTLYICPWHKTNKGNSIAKAKEVIEFVINNSPTIKNMEGREQLRKEKIKRERQIG